MDQSSSERCYEHDARRPVVTQAALYAGKRRSKKSSGTHTKHSVRLIDVPDGLEIYAHSTLAHLVHAKQCAETRRAGDYHA